MTAKAGHVAAARAMVSLALQASPPEDSWEVLRGQAARLQLAEARERRALAIQEWPFDEGILRTILAITTSVVTAIVARLILSRLGL